MYKYFNPAQDPKMVGLSNTLMQMLDDAREIAGIPFIITSGIRTQEENAELDMPNSKGHLDGFDVDILCLDSIQAFLIVLGAYKAGFKRIGHGTRHIHLDIRQDATQNVLFFDK
jgi:hypothetical protein